MVFEGLDTFAQVKLNGLMIGIADNFHRTWTFNVKNLVRGKENVLDIKFKSAEAYVIDQTKNSMMLTQMYGHARKPHFHFGWDWSPKLTTVGIFKAVYIRAYS